MIQIEYVAKKRFKYDGRIIRKGDVFAPSGGRFDDQILDVENGFVYQRQVKSYQCPNCERVFDSPQGLAGHSGFCKKK